LTHKFESINLGKYALFIKLRPLTVVVKGQLVQDCQDRSARTGQQEQNSGKGQLGQDCQGRTSTVGPDCQDRTDRIGWSEHDSKDRIGRQESLDRAARI
jgi:hypothetical protein